MRAWQAKQDVRRRASACHVGVEVNSGKVAGYCTLAGSGAPLTDLPVAMINCRIQVEFALRRVG